MKGDRLARGTVYAVAAQVAAASLGFLLTIFLGRQLGPTLFGRYGVIISFLAWAEFLVITGVPDAVSRSIAAEGRRRGAIFRAGLRLELIFAALLFALFYLSAPWFSSRLFHNPSLAGAFRLAALDIPLYALFAIHLGYIRGVRGFARQSWSIVTYASAKCFSAILLVWAGLSLEGALIGNAIGSLGALLLARLLVTRDLPPRASGEIPWPSRALAGYGLPLVACILLFNALISIDLWMVERLMVEDRDVGLYTAAWNMARTPYYLCTGLSVVLFPAMARVLAAGDQERARRYILEAARLFLIIAIPLVLFSAISASGLMGLAFSSAFRPHQSGPLFAVLIAGYALLSFSLICNAALTAAGRLRLVITVNLVLVVSQIGLTHWLIPRLGLAGAALSTLVIGGGAFLAGQALLASFFGAGPGLTGTLRIVLASLPAAALLLVLPTTGGLLILAYAACSLVYLLGLFILGEIKWCEVVGYVAQFRPND